MKNILSVNKRNKDDDVSELRTNGILPSVVYGKNTQNTLISTSILDFNKVLKNVGESGTISLEIKGNEALKEKTITLDVLVHDIQYNPLTNTPIHVDFLAIDINQPVEVTIPLEYTGVAPAEKNGLGILVKVLHEIDVRALPKDLPHTIKVDLNNLNNLDDQLRIEDIYIPNSIEIITDKDEVVALISQIKEEKVEENPVDLSSIEVEKKGKKEEEA